MENRRKFLRVSFEAKFEIKTESWTDKTATGLDISLNGCRFNCEQFLSEDETVTISFGPNLDFKGGIRWCWPIEWYYTAAVNFGDITELEQQKLKSYIEEVTGEYYKMKKEEEEEEENNILNEDLDEDNDDLDFETEDVSDNINFDVVGDDQNDFEQNDYDDKNSSEIEDLPQLSIEDLENLDDDPPLENSSSLSKVIQNENILHKFAEGDLSPLSFRGKKVIIFDMEIEQAEILNRYLTERLGMEVDSVSKKHNLWRHMKIDHVDLIIIETGSISDSDALEVMQQTNDQFPRVNYFCISGPVSLERRMQFLNAGALDYLTRPIHLSSIAQSILVHLSKMDFYKKEIESEESESSTELENTKIKNTDTSETFHDKDLTEKLDLLDQDLDVSREIELVDEDY